VGPEPGEDLLQLDQLRLAEGSPVRAAVEDDERLSLPARGVQVHRGAALVRQADVGEALSYEGDASIAQAPSQLNDQTPERQVVPG
jgi:hypothetical protein